MANQPIDGAAADQVRLRHWVCSDAEGIARLLQDKPLQRCLPGTPSTCSTAYAADLIAEAAAKWAKGRCISLAICHASDGRLLGEVSLNLLSKEVGIWLGAEYWRCGHGRSAIQALLRFAQFGLGVNSAQALIRRDNPSSQALFEKCGFVFAGLQHGGIDQGFVPSLKYQWYATLGTGRILAGATRDNSLHHALQD